MQRYFFLFVTLFVLGGSALAQRPNTGTCWDFEETCPSPQNAFYQLCVPDAFASSGSPQIDNFIFGSNTPAASGLQHASMALRHCPAFEGEPADQRGDGILLNTTIEGYHKYELKFYTFGPMSTLYSTLGVHLVSNLPNNGNITPASISSCIDNNYIIPGIPANAQTLTAPAPPAGSNGWIEQRIVFTASSNFSQIWFRPFLKMENIHPNTGTVINEEYRIDNVCIRDITCEVEKFKVTGCRPNENPDQVVFTLTGGGNVAQGDWKLYKLSDCGSNVLGPEITVNWLSPTTFTLPANTGCYRFGYRIDNPLCEQRFVSVILKTDSRDVPLCTPVPPVECVPWGITTEEEYCNTLWFRVANYTTFPAGTVITATLNGQPVLTTIPGELEYSPYVSGDNRHIKVCFTVQQPGCQPETQCTTFFVWDCGGFGRPSGRSFSESPAGPIKINNPADTYIRLSQPLAQGVAELYSMQGALLKSFQLNDTQLLDVADVPNGQYMLSIRHAGGRDSRLVLILHQP